MSHATFPALVQNAALLLAFVVAFDLVAGRHRLTSTPWRGILLGIVLGLLGIGLILSAFRLEAGIVFDTRSVLLGISGLFFGALPTLVAMAMTAAFRLWQGGMAAWTGVAVILTSGGLGIAWRWVRRRPLVGITVIELATFGVVIHLLMLALMLTLPWEYAQRVLRAIGLPVLLVFPAATTALGLILANRLRREAAVLALAESEARYRSLFENNHATMLIVQPADGAIVDANPAAERFYGWTREQLRQMRITEINTLPPERVAAELEQARRVHRHCFLFSHRRADGSVRDVEVFTGPIQIAGRSLLYSIVHDVTERKEAEAKLADQMEELRRWHCMTLGREHRVLELKREVNELLRQTGQPARYPSVLPADASPPAANHRRDQNPIPRPEPRAETQSALFPARP